MSIYRPIRTGILIGFGIVISAAITSAIVFLVAWFLAGPLKGALYS